jgi:hypothetical protein
MLLSAMLFMGCASPVTKDGIMPTSFNIVNRSPKVVVVTARGGEKTSLEKLSRADDELLQEVIIESIKKSGLFSMAIKSGTADYKLDAVMLVVIQPSIIGPYALKGRVRMLWKLTRVQDGEPVFQDVIDTEHSTTIGEAFNGYTRLRKATEGAIRKNIQQAIERISKTEF